jgi:hypothetical protein
MGSRALRALDTLNEPLQDPFSGILVATGTETRFTVGYARMSDEEWAISISGRWLRWSGCGTVNNRSQDWTWS